MRPLSALGSLLARLAAPRRSVATHAAVRIDPAPSRWSYRLHRLMLTPMFRLVLRVGVPLCLVAGVATAYFADQDRRDALRMAIADMRDSIESRPEFMVRLMAIDGAAAALSEDIREIVPIDFPISSFDLELDAIRQTIAGLDAVENVSLRIRPGGVLQVDVTERQPVVLWRNPDGLEKLDAGGVRTGPVAARGDRPDLPLIAGLGANSHVAEALAIVAAAAPLASRLRGLVRVGLRRWDVVLDRGQRILLPENGPVQALERVIALHQAQDLLGRDLTVVDMRIAARPTLRLSENAVGAMWQIKQAELGERME